MAVADTAPNHRKRKRTRRVVVLALAAAVGLSSGLAVRSLVPAAATRTASRVLAAVERRLGVVVRYREHRLVGWRTFELTGVEVWAPDVATPPLFTAPLLRVRAGLSMDGLVAEAVELRGASLRVGPDLVRALGGRFSGERDGAGALAGVAPGRVAPRVLARATTVIFEGPSGADERWELPVATLVPEGRGRVTGAAELLAGTGLPHFLALSGAITRHGIDLGFESALPLRPAVLAAWIGREVAFRGVRLGPGGVTLNDVELSVPTSVGTEVMARLPSLYLRQPRPHQPARVETVRPAVRLERYPDGTSNLQDVADVVAAGGPPGPSAGGEPEPPTGAGMLPALRVRGGELTLVDYSRGAPPMAVSLDDLHLALDPNGAGYDLSGRWQPERGAGSLNASGRLSARDSFDLLLDTDSLDLARLARTPSLEIRQGRAGGRIRIQGEGPVVRATGKVRLEDLDVVWALLARDPVEGVDLTADLDVRWDRTTGRLTLENLAANLGAIELTAWGTLRDGSPKSRYDVHIALGPLPCDDILRSLPTAMKWALADLELAGHVTLRLRLTGSLDDFDTLALSVDGETSDFRVLSGGPDVAALARPFLHTAREPDGAVIPVSVDPGVPGFTSLLAVPRSLQSAITSSEDAAFWRHDGLDFRQIGASLARNLESGELRRGGSTITQQLVKNLFLGRQKTLSRKLQEAYLASRVEAHLTKARILEIYVNVVEWGPGVYGVRRAADYYFHKHPSHLTLRESAFLASILPNPRLLGRRDEAGRPLPHVRRKVDRVLRRMVSLGRATWEQTAREGALRLHQPLGG